MYFSALEFAQDLFKKMVAKETGKIVFTFFPWGVYNRPYAFCLLCNKTRLEAIAEG